jgi:hypothetical protein
MTLYSVSLHVIIERDNVRETVNLIREDLYVAYRPVDIGGSYRNGVFDIWVTIDAADERTAVDIAEGALHAAAVRVDTGDRTDPLPLAIKAGTGPAEWLTIKSADAKQVLLTSDGLELALG